MSALRAAAAAARPAVFLTPLPLVCASCRSSLLLCAPLSRRTPSYRLLSGITSRALGGRTFRSTAGERSQEDAAPRDIWLENVGRATEKLPRELERFLNNNFTGLDKSIYSDDIEFSEPFISGFHVRGKRAYNGLAWLSRCGLKWYFRDTAFVVNSVTQSRPGDADYGWPGGPGGGLAASPTRTAPSVEPVRQSDSTARVDDPQQLRATRSVHVRIRWTFSGTPRPKALFNSASAPCPESVYTGLFIYTFDSNGLINLHRIQRIHPAPTRQTWRLNAWAWLLGGKLRPLEVAMMSDNSLHTEHNEC